MITRRSAHGAVLNAFAWALLATCAACAVAAATNPLASVTRQSLVYHHVDGPWARGNLALFEVEFSDTVRFSGGALSGWQTITELNGTTATPPVNAYASTSYAPLFLRVVGSVLINCTKPDGTAVVYTSDTPIDTNGMPVGAVVVPATRAPLLSGMAVYGALPMNSTWLWLTGRENVVAIMLFIDGEVFQDVNGNGVYTPVPFTNKNATLAAFRTWQCSATLGVQDATANPGTVAVRVGTDAPLTDNTTAVFVESTPRCVTDDIQDMWRVLNRYMLPRNTDDVRREHLRPLQILISSATLFESWPGCNVVASGLIAERDNVTLSNVAAAGPHSDVAWHEGYCMFARGTTEYSASPCCNRMLASTMCCDPPANTTSIRSVIASYTGVDSDAFTAPSAIKGILADFNAEIQRVRMPVWSFDALWSSWTNLESTCWTRIQQQTCQIDTDCQYSSFCETTVNGVGSGLCHVNWDAVELPLTRCYLDLAAPFDKAILLAHLNVSDDSATLEQDVAAAIKRVATQVDCIGPAADAYRKNSTVAYDSNGVAYVVPYGGDQAGCVSAYTCNWNDAFDFASCMDTTRHGVHLCGVSRGNGLYVNRRVRARCVAPELTDSNTPGGQADTACSQIGGTMVFLDGNTVTRQCVWVNVTSSEECLAQSGGAGGTMSPFCATYAADIQARAALVPSPTGSTFSKSYPSYSTLFAMCTNPSGHRSSLSSSSTGPFCYSIPGTMTRANCTALANTARLDGDTSLFGGMQNQTYWVESESTCVSFVAGSAGPQTVPSTFAVSYADLNTTFCSAYSNYSQLSTLMQFHRPVRWQPGEYDTYAACDQGLCQTPGLAIPGATRAACAASTTQCTTRCSGCRSALGATAGFLSETLRRREDGTAGLCVLADAACSNTLYFAYNGAGTNRTFGTTTKCVAEVDRWKCATMSGTYYACNDLDSVSTCPRTGIASPSTVADYIYQYLKCQWSDSVPCVGTAACLAGGGTCNDQITTDCACSTASGCACTNGTCVLVHDLYPPTDRPRCPTWHPEIIDTASGCRNLSALSPSSCTSNGGGWTWMARGGSNAALCESNAAVCLSSDLPSRSNGFSRRGTTDCTACGGASESLYTHTAPAVVSGSTVDTVWAPRNWTTVNQWRTGISRTQLVAFLNAAARSSIAVALHAYVADQFRPLSGIYLKLASALGQGPLPTFDAMRTLSAAFGFICVFPASTTSQVCDLSGVTLTMASSSQANVVVVYTVTPGVAASDINASIALAPTAAALASPFIQPLVAVVSTPANTSADSALPGPSPYAVVVDPDHAHAIGQVVGTLVNFEVLNGSMGTVTVCIDKSPEIAIDSGYTVPDFGVAVGSGTAADPFWIVPAGLTDATANDARVCGTIALAKACASAQTSGCAVVPIYRQTDIGEQSSGTSMWVWIGVGIGAAVIIVAGTAVVIQMRANSVRTRLPQD